MKPITPCLWFDSQAEEAANFYCGIFPDSRITAISRFGEAGFEHHGRPAGSVMVAAFELNGQPYTALNGGPLFRFNEAVSLQVMCDTQAEVDHYWSRLADGGDPTAQACGWLKDRYGVSWQVVPVPVIERMAEGTSPGAQRMFAAMMPMKKLDIAPLLAAYEG